MTPSPTRAERDTCAKREAGASQDRIACTGGMAEGKAGGGGGTVRCKAGGWSIRGAALRGCAMLPCRSVFAQDDGDTFAGPP